MTKKLEPGCKAIIVNAAIPEYNGIIVTVIEYAGEIKGWVGKHRWITDRRFDGVIEGTYTYTVQEHHLQRIDDREETTTWEAMRDLWVPEQVKTREISGQ